MAFSEYVSSSLSASDSVSLSAIERVILDDIVRTQNVAVANNNGAVVRDEPDTAKTVTTGKGKAKASKGAAGGAGNGQSDSRKRPATPANRGSPAPDAPSQGSQSKEGASSSRALTKDDADVRPAKAAKTGIHGREDGQEGHRAPSMGAAHDDVSAADYEAMHMWRAHGSGPDGDDSSSSVYACAFEPNPDGTTTHIIDTCGGEVVIGFDLDTGKALWRDKRPNEVFYALASRYYPATAQSSAHTIVAAGGTHGRPVRRSEPDD